MYQVPAEILGKPRLRGIRCLSAWAVFSYCLFACLITVFGQKEEEDKSGEQKPAALQNPVLREFFRAQHYSVSSDKTGHQAPPSFVEDFVDLRVEDFLQRTRSQLDQIKSDVEALDVAYRLYSEDNSPVNMQSLRVALDHAEDHSNRLRKSLSLIFAELRSKSKSVRPPSDLGSDIEFVQNRLIEASQRVEDYLFSSDPVVHVDGLQNQNMLTYLHEAQKMSKQLRKDLSRRPNSDTKSD